MTCATQGQRGDRCVARQDEQGIGRREESAHTLTLVALGNVRERVHDSAPQHVEALPMALSPKTSTRTNERAKDRHAWHPSWETPSCLSQCGTQRVARWVPLCVHHYPLLGREDSIQGAAQEAEWGRRTGRGGGHTGMGRVGSRERKQRYAMGCIAAAS